MAIGKRIKEARINRNLTQEELAKIVGVTKGAIANYESNTSHPKEPIIYSLMEALNVDANFLFQDNIKTKKASPIPDEAMQLAKDYTDLDFHGKRMVQIVVDEEKDRMKEETKRAQAEADTSGKDRTDLEREADEFAALAREQYLSEKRQDTQASSAKESGAG